MSPRSVAAIAGVAVVAACVGDAPAGSGAASAPAVLPAVRAGSVEVSRVLMAEPLPGGRTALYLDVTNRGEQPDTLLAVDVGPVGSASIHRTEVSDGVSRMRAAGPLEVPRGGGVALRPGGLHVMIEGLSRSLTAGDTVDVAVVLARAGTVRARALVVGYADLDEVLDPGG